MLRGLLCASEGFPRIVPSFYKRLLTPFSHTDTHLLCLRQQPRSSRGNCSPSTSKQACLGDAPAANRQFQALDTEKPRVWPKRPPHTCRPSLSAQVLASYMPIVPLPIQASRHGQRFRPDTLTAAPTLPPSGPQWSEEIVFGAVAPVVFWRR